MIGQLKRPIVLDKKFVFPTAEEALELEEEIIVYITTLETIARNSVKAVKWTNHSPDRQARALKVLRKELEVILGELEEYT